MWANVTDDLGLFTGRMPGRHALDGLLAAFEEIDTNTNEVTVRENLRTKINKFLPALRELSSRRTVGA